MSHQFDFENQIFSRRLTWVNLKKTRYISIFPNGPFWHNEGGGAWLLIRVIPCRVAELFYSNQYQNCAICHDENMQAVASILEQSESNYVRFIFCYNLYNVHGTVQLHSTLVLLSLLLSPLIQRIKRAYWHLSTSRKADRFLLFTC